MSENSSKLGDVQIFDETGAEEKNEGYFSSFTGYLGKGSKSKGQKEEEKKDDSKKIGKSSKQEEKDKDIPKTETMISKAKNRH